MQEQQAIEYVGFWQRAIAVVIDSFFVTLLIIPILFFILNDPMGSSTAGMAVQIILPAIAFIAFWQARSTTPGKMAIGAIIVNADDLQKPSMKQWLLRYLGYYLASLPLCLGFIWAGFDARKQGWHDKLAKTVVIKVKKA